MKIRWTAQSVRLRITPAELAALERGEETLETLKFGNGQWRASLGAGAATALSLEGGELRVLLGPDDVQSLAHPETEGVYFSIEGIRYFVEKDFPCAHPRALEALESPSETFAPPPDFEARKNA